MGKIFKLRVHIDGSNWTKLPQSMKDFYWEEFKTNRHSTSYFTSLIGEKMMLNLQLQLQRRKNIRIQRYEREFGERESTSYNAFVDEKSASLDDKVKARKLEHFQTPSIYLDIVGHHCKHVDRYLGRSSISSRKSSLDDDEAMEDNLSCDEFDNESLENSL